ncbi:HD-GYP domain-containing protein [Parashewanella tropica]|uniref:HD-GYP domain-containing protein n=1 Tax=Parashewanella tropica TaxID=2547970 RepID=UPI0014783A8D|nr:HD-GYP domain-containing protein [Parashewanella tropica]
MPNLVKIPVSDVQLGMKVKIPTSWKDHPFFRSSIWIKTNKELQVIKGLGLPYVYLLEGHYQVTEQVQKPEELSVQGKESYSEQSIFDHSKEIKQAIHKSQKRFSFNINENQVIHSKLLTDPDGAYRLSAGVADQLYQHLTETEDTHLCTVKKPESHRDVSQHCVSVAVISMLLAKVIGLSEEQIRDVAQGALVHDYGKSKVPDSIVRKTGELTNSEKNFLNLHPTYGVNILKPQGVWSEAVLSIVGSHHEFIDGSGFPKQLKGKQIPITTQVVSLANEFENLLNDSRFSSSKLALGYLYKNGSKRHDPELLAALIKTIGVFPPGTIVKLQDGCFAKVLVNKNHSNFPDVLSCTESGSKAKMRCLEDEQVAIDSVVNKGELPENVLQALGGDQAVSFYFCSE